MSTHLTADVRLTRPGGFQLDVSLDAPAGTTTVVLGPNGAGKSTLLAAVAGLLAVDDGAISLGQDVLDRPSTGTWVPPEARGFGVVLQGGVLFDHLTVRANIAFGPRAQGRGRAAAHATAGRWLARIGITDLAERYPPELSGGQAQRVALARALASEPRALLLDEPFSALDVTGRLQLRRTLADLLAGFPGPRVLVTHDPTEAFLLGDVLHVVEDGRTAQVGDADDVRLRPRTPYVADLAGVNLVAGTARDGTVTTDGHRFEVAEHTIDGSVLLTIAPHAIALHQEPPGGSPRNVWPTTVERVEPAGERVRVLLGPPQPLTAEVTRAAAAALDLRPGLALHASLKATEIRIAPQGQPT